MRLIVTIDCDGAAFDGAARRHECARMLRLAAERVAAAGTGCRETLRDDNGNRCGSVEWVDARS